MNSVCFRTLSRTAAAASFLSAAMLLTAPANAEPVRAFVTANLNQRAGPDTRFPVLATVPEGNPVTVFGCLSDLSWCDGAYRNTRGWFSARYLSIPYGSSYLTVGSYVRYAYLPTVSFRINSYWDRYYRNRPFYAQLSFYADGGSVSVSVGSFYRPLSPYGSWTEVRGRNVWVPRVDADWRPYTNGRWVYTKRYGWTWVSREPFGWATDHYGRWAYSSRIGWFWVPGTRWAPAWVAWRRSPDYVAWAPMPPNPDDGFGVSFQISFGNIPNYYWRPVRWRDFGSQDASTVIIGDNNQVINIINQTEPAGTVKIENNVVVNNVINVDYVEQQTGETVVAKELSLTSSESKAGQVTDNAVEIYHPTESELAPEAAPAEVVPEEQVAQESATAGQGGDQPATEDLVPPAPGPKETPPESAQATESPPLLGEGEQPAAASGPPAVDQGPTPEGVEPCPEDTARQQDGSCGAPAAEAPPAEEVTPETQTAPATPPAQAQPGQPPVLPPPGESAQPSAPALPGSAEPCPAGSVRQQDGSCGTPAAHAPPADQVTPETQAAPPVPPSQAEPGQPPALPPPGGGVQPPAPPAQQQEVPLLVPEPPPQAAPAPQPEPVQPAPPPEQQRQAPPPPEPPVPPEPPQAPPAPEPPQAPPAPGSPPQQSAPPEPPQQQPASCPEGQAPNPQGHCVPQ